MGEFGRDNGLADVTGREICQYVWRTCYASFGGDSSVLVVLSVGPQADALVGLPEAPPNFIVRKSVPQLEVLARCDLVVMHGGANTLHEALGFALPLIVVPMFADQPGNARSVARSGAAITFSNPMETLSATTLRNAVEKLLDPHQGSPYRDAARALQGKLRSAGGVPRAADVILKHAPRPQVQHWGGA